MKHAVVLVIASAFLLLPALTAEPDQPLILRGIISISDPNLPPIKMAIIPLSGPFRGDALLREGDGDFKLSVEAILPESGTVVVKYRTNQEPIELRLPDAVAARAEPPGFQFRSNSIGNLVDLLQMLTSRTIIAPAQTLHQRMNLTSAALHSRSEAASVLEKVLRTNSLVSQTRGQKFALLLPTSETNLFATIPDPPSTGQPTNDVLPPGLIKFSDAHVFQALDFYQLLSGRTVIYPNRISGNVAVRTETALARDEAVWMMNAVLRFAGVAIVPEGDKFVFAVAPSMTNSLLHFDRKAALAKAAITNDGAAAPIRLSGADPQQVLDMAAVIMGRIPIPILPPIEVPRFETYNLRTEPLDQAESIYALEAWAHLNGLAFELVGPDELTITQRASNQP